MTTMESEDTTATAKRPLGAWKIGIGAVVAIILLLLYIWLANNNYDGAGGDRQENGFSQGGRQGNRAPAIRVKRETIVLTKKQPSRQFKIPLGMCLTQDHQPTEVKAIAYSSDGGKREWSREKRGAMNVQFWTYTLRQGIDRSEVDTCLTPCGYPCGLGSTG
jgi:hypothetical protein